jgi:hypothetical protein
MRFKKDDRVKYRLEKWQWGVNAGEWIHGTVHNRFGNKEVVWVDWEEGRGSSGGRCVRWIHEYKLEHDKNGLERAVEKAKS